MIILNTTNLHKGILEILQITHSGPGSNNIEVMTGASLLDVVQCHNQGTCRLRKRKNISIKEDLYITLKMNMLN